MPVHDVGQADGAPFLVSDFVEGVTLTDLPSARRPDWSPRRPRLVAPPKSYSLPPARVGKARSRCSSWSSSGSSSL